MWFTAIFRGSAPWGLRNYSAYAIRYSAQLYSYLFLITDVYPHASPLEGADEPVAPFAEAHEEPSAEAPVAPTPTEDTADAVHVPAAQATEPAAPDDTPPPSEENV